MNFIKQVGGIFMRRVGFFLSYLRLFCLFLVLLLFGCGAAVNPYSSNFECPQAEKGKCIGVPEAYKESITIEKISNKTNATVTNLNDLKQLQVNVRDEFLLSPSERDYIENLYNVITKLLKDPQTPVITSPKIVRVLILPYQSKDGKNFYSARYVYVLVDEPKWVLQNILRGYPSAEE